MKRGVRRALIAGMCGALVLAFAGIAGGKIKTKTFSSGTIDLDVAGFGGTASHTFALNKKRFKRAKVKDVDLALRISSEHGEDLNLTLTAPNGASTLVNNQGGPHRDEFGTGSESCSGSFAVFNDEAETPIDDFVGGSAVGQFQPTERLSSLDGSKLKGQWRLDAEDVDSGASAIHCAELKVKYKKKKRK